MNNNGVARRLNFGNANALPPPMPEIRARPNKANIAGNNKSSGNKGVLQQVGSFISGLNPFAGPSETEASPIVPKANTNLSVSGGRRSRSKTRKAHRKAKTQRKNRKGRKTHGRRH